MSTGTVTDFLDISSSTTRVQEILDHVQELSSALNDNDFYRIIIQLGDALCMQVPDAQTIALQIVVYVQQNRPMIQEECKNIVVRKRQHFKKHEKHIVNQFYLLGKKPASKGTLTAVAGIASYFFAHLGYSGYVDNIRHTNHLINKFNHMSDTEKDNKSPKSFQRMMPLQHTNPYSDHMAIQQLEEPFQIPSPDVSSLFCPLDEPSSEYELLDNNYLLIAPLSRVDPNGNHLESSVVSFS